MLIHISSPDKSVRVSGELNVDGSHVFGKECKGSLSGVKTSTLQLMRSNFIIVRSLLRVVA